MTLEFKGELGETLIEEVFGLKPKMYSILAGGKQKLSAKGVAEFAQLKLTHEFFKTIRQTGESFKTLNTRIGSTRHQLQTIKTSKLSLSSFGDKRSVLEDGMSSLPHGHYMISDVHVEQDILMNQNGYENEKMPTSPTWDELNVVDP